MGKNEKWSLGTNHIEVVNSYTYLGYTFTTKLSVAQGVNRLVMKGKKAVYDCARVLRKLNEMSRQTFFQIFDAQVQPILMYGSEVWGLETVQSIEKVHTVACKRFLNVPLKTPNKCLYGDLGRYPLHVNTCLRIVKYWLKLLKMDSARLPKQAYQMQVGMTENGKICWASKLKELLYKHGFGHIWLEQEVGNEQSFLSLLRHKLIDSFYDDWKVAINTSDRFSFYASFKLRPYTELYIDEVRMKYLRDILAKLRLGVLPLNANVYRYAKENTNKILCSFCKDQTENEIHFVCECPCYKEIRYQYFRTNSLDTNYFIYLIKCTDPILAKDLALFVKHAINKRDIMNVIT